MVVPAAAAVRPTPRSLAAGRPPARDAEGDGAGRDDLVQVRPARAWRAATSRRRSPARSSLRSRAASRAADGDDRALLDRLADSAREAYRAFVWEEPSFAEFFRAFTPVDELAMLELASRPARRPGDAELPRRRCGRSRGCSRGRRTACCCPRGSERGTAFGEASDDSLRDLYQRLPFFRTVVDNLEMTLAKSSLPIARGLPDARRRRPAVRDDRGGARQGGRGRPRRGGRIAPARAPTRAAPLDRAPEPLRRPDERRSGRAAEALPRRATKAHGCPCSARSRRSRPPSATRGSRV